MTDDVAKLSAAVLAAQALSVAALELQAAWSSDGFSAVAERVRVQLAHVTLTGGDPQLNREVLALAAARIETDPGANRGTSQLAAACFSTK